MSQCVFCMEKVHYLEKKLHFFSLNACPLEEKSPFLSFLGATKTKPCSFWTKKVWPDWCHSYLHSGGMEIRGIWISLIV